MSRSALSRQSSSGGGAEQELHYAEKLTDTTVSSTNSAAPTSIFAGTSLTFDGSTRIKIEFFASQIRTASNGDVVIALYENGTFVKALAGGPSGGAVTPGQSMKGELIFTPSAGTRTYSIGGYGSAGAATIFADASGFSRTWFRISAYPTVIGGGGADPNAGGWTSAGESWTYASADDPTYTFTIGGDLTGKYSPGMRVRLSQATGGTKYFIVTKVAYSGGTTTVTVYGGTDYDLNNETISLPYYSTHKAPVGFPLDPLKWTVVYDNSSDLRMSSPSAGVWQNPGSASLSIPIGAWEVFCKWDFATTLGKDVVASLSTANNSATDNNFTVEAYNTGGSTQVTVFSRGALALTAKTTYYLVQKSDVGGAGTYGLFGAGNVPVRIRAVCSYL